MLFGLAGFVADFSQEFSAFFDIFVGFDAFTSGAVDDSYDASSLFSFCYDDFEGVRGCCVDCGYFWDGFDLV